MGCISFKSGTKYSLVWDCAGKIRVPLSYKGLFYKKRHKLIREGMSYNLHLVLYNEQLFKIMFLLPNRHKMVCEGTWEQISDSILVLNFNDLCCGVRYYNKYGLFRVDTLIKVPSGDWCLLINKNISHVCYEAKK